MDRSYPSAIRFWVRMEGVPLQFLANETFRAIGESIGEVIEIDYDDGRVKLELDGFKPLIMESEVEFSNGVEIIGLRYEKLHGFCRKCFSLCHDMHRCPSLGREERLMQDHRQKSMEGDKSLSYRGATSLNAPKSAAGSSFTGSSRGLRGPIGGYKRRGYGNNQTYQKRMPVSGAAPAERRDLLAEITFLNEKMAQMEKYSSKDLVDLTGSAAKKTRRALFVDTDLNSDTLELEEKGTEAADPQTLVLPTSELSLGEKKNPTKVVSKTEQWLLLLYLMEYPLFTK